MTLGATPTPAEILAELAQLFPYTFPDARTRWLADLAAGDPIVFPTSFANKLSVKVVHTVADAGGSSPHTFSSCNFGLAFPDRVLVPCICLRGNGASAINITNVTVGGAATLGSDNGEFLAGGPAIGAGIFAGALASGTSGDIVVTWTGQNANAAGLILLSIAKISTTATASDGLVGSGSGGTSASGSLDIPANGILIVASSHSNTNDATLSGVTERSAINVGSGRFEVGFDNRMGIQRNRAVSASWSGNAARGFHTRSYAQA